MSLVSEEEVMYLARTMRLPRKRDKIILFQQVNWRLTKRIMVLKWTRFPSDVVYHILSFIGNESELESRKKENKEKYTRRTALAGFRIDSEFWLTLTQQQADPRVCEVYRKGLVEMGAKLKKHPPFPWDI